MLDLRRKYIQTRAELRENPRIELHLPVTIIGVDTEAHVIDFSLGGFYIETDASKMFNTGQKVKIALKLPCERNGIAVKAEVVYRSSNGFGCKFYDLLPETRQALERCFNIFSETLPILVSVYEEGRTSAAA